MFLSGAVDLRFDAEPVDSAVWDVAWTKLALEVPRELFWRMLNYIALGFSWTLDCERVLAGRVSR